LNRHTLNSFCKIFYNYFHIVIVSENFDCIDEVLTIEFEDKVNVKYLLIKKIDKYKSYNKIKTINIKAY